MLDHQQQLSREDSLAIIKQLRSVPSDKTLEIILHTPGGLLSAAEIICQALLNHTGHKIVYVPYSAASAGVIIALAGDEIYLGKNAYIGPANPMFMFGYSAQQVIDYVSELQSDTSWISDIVKFVKIEAQHAISWHTQLINKICTKKNVTLSQECQELLFSGNQCHDKPLFYNDLCDHLEFLNDGVPEDIYTILDLVK